MKNTSRNKFLLCFRPVVDMDVMLESRGVLRSSNNCGMLCESVQDKGITKTPASKSVSSNLVLHRPPNRKLSRVIKAVRPRARESQRRSKCITNNETSLDSDDQRQKRSTDFKTDIGEMKHLIISPHSSSSSESNISSRTISKVEEVKHNPNKRRVNVAVNKKTTEMDCYILYLVLAVMIFTVFWGKLGGILSTTIWLYCHPHRQSSYSRQTNRSSLSQRQGPETMTRRGSSS